MVLGCVKYFTYLVFSASILGGLRFSDFHDEAAAERSRLRFLIPRSAWPVQKVDG